MISHNGQRHAVDAKNASTPTTQLIKDGHIVALKFIILSMELV